VVRGVAKSLSFKGHIFSLVLIANAFALKTRNRTLESSKGLKSNRRLLQEYFIGMALWIVVRSGKKRKEEERRRKKRKQIYFRDAFSAA